MLGQRWWTALWTLSILVSPASVLAHNATLVVSCGGERHSALEVNGPLDYLAGSACVALEPGVGEFAGNWMADAPGIATLSEDGLLRGRVRLEAGHRLALELVRAEPGFAMLEPSSWKVVLAKAGDRYELAHDPRGDLSIQMISRSNRAGSTSATFRFVDLSGRHSPSQPFTLCFSTEPARTADTQAPPASYLEAIRRLWTELTQAEAAIAAREPSRAGDAAVQIAALAQQVPGLARAPGSGVAPLDANGIEAHPAALRAAAAGLHQAVDFGDSVAAKQALAKARSEIDSLTAYAPRLYTCPMGCADGKTYPAPGKCPVCGMELIGALAHLDHTPKHGGTFLMSPDLRHHLEIVTREGELRLYLYDEFTRPLRADSVRARIEFEPPAGGKGSIALARDRAPECLRASLPAGRLSARGLVLRVRFAREEPEQTYPLSAETEAAPPSGR